MWKPCIALWVNRLCKSLIYYGLSIYCGYIWYDIVHSATITMNKFQSCLHPGTTPHSSSLLRTSYGLCFGSCTMEIDRDISKHSVPWDFYIETNLGLLNLIKLLKLLDNAIDAPLHQSVPLIILTYCQLNPKEYGASNNVEPNIANTVIR